MSQCLRFVLAGAGGGGFVDDADSTDDDADDDGDVVDADDYAVDAGVVFCLWHECLGVFSQTFALLEVDGMHGWIYTIYISQMLHVGNI